MSVFLIEKLLKLQEILMYRILRVYVTSFTQKVEKHHSRPFRTVPDNNTPIMFFLTLTVPGPVSSTLCKISH